MVGTVPEARKPTLSIKSVVSPPWGLLLMKAISMEDAVAVNGALTTWR